jgi:hypothetical protein
MQGESFSPSFAGRPASTGLGSRGKSRAARWAYPRRGYRSMQGIPSGVEVM